MSNQINLEVKREKRIDENLLKFIFFIKCLIRFECLLCLLKRDLMKIQESRFLAQISATNQMTTRIIIEINQSDEVFSFLF